MTSPTTRGLTRQDVVSAFAAAAGQRVIALAGDGRAGLDKLRAAALSDGTTEPHVVYNNHLPTLVDETSLVSLAALPYTGVPSATMGRRMASQGATGSGDTWRAGDGLAALNKLLDNADAETFPPQVLGRIRTALRTG